MHSSSLNIAIAGGGLLGRLLAWRLLCLNHNVTLYETGSFTESPRAAAYTAAAMISPMSEVVSSQHSIYAMGMASLALWEAWHNKHLPVEFNGLYTNSGSVVVAHPQDHAELLQFFQDLQHHLGSANNSQWLDASNLRQLEPDLSEDLQQGLLLPNEGYLHNRAFLDRLLNLIKIQGAELVAGAHIVLREGLTVNGQPLPAYDILFDCRGMGSKESEPTLRGVRGEVIWVETAEIKLHRPIRLMHPRYKLYVVPKPNNQFIIGATEIESEDRSAVSVQSALELCSALYTINPAFAEARIIEMDTNLRPTYLDNIPAITDKTVAKNNGELQRVIAINGLYRHGYLLAPYLVEYTLQITELAIPNTPYANLISTSN